MRLMARRGVNRKRGFAPLRRPVGGGELGKFKKDVNPSSKIPPPLL